MSYAAALQAWKDRTSNVTPGSPEPVLRAVEQGSDPELVSRSRAWWIGGCLGVVVASFAAMALVESYSMPMYARAGRGPAVVLPIISMVLAMRWLRRRDLAKQMMVRALVWSVLVIGVLIAVFGAPLFALVGSCIAVPAGIALLAMGGRGLGATSRSFRPTAFRTHLTIALVMAMADAQTLVFSAVLKFGGLLQQAMAGEAVSWATGVVSVVPVLLCGLVMVVAVFGIYRLATWALLLNLVANIAIAYVAMSGAIGLTLPVASALATTALVQMMLPVPILAAGLGDPLRDRRPWGRMGRPAAVGTIVLMMLAGILGPSIPVMIRDGTGNFVVRTGWIEGARRTRRSAGPRRAPAVAPLVPRER